jgi:mycothiol system anti-sigma-R factor
VSRDDVGEDRGDRGSPGGREDLGVDRARPAAAGGAPSGGALDTSALFGPSVDCTEAVRELYVYLDGELTEVRREEIRVHLDGCGPCGGAAEFEAELRRVIANRCKDRVPQSLIERVAMTIEAESKQHDDGR